MAGGAGACAGEARSVALETAYVHDVYEEISGASSTNCSSRAWPKVAQFLHDLEPGALVCDVGCGNGKYLSINPAVFKIGADRCLSLTELARENQHEVLVCDNLALPFRDECFDAVLSVAVVHHLATTERRVSAIRELTRVLRIGGRLVITVWAMEQRHRKFESQDVLVPWHRPQRLSTPSLELTSTTTSEEDLHPPYHAYTQTSDSDSGSGQRGAQRGRRDHGLDPALPVSQSSSSLSSPNETCYSFVRRALQRLAGSKRSAPWFLDSWSASALSPLRDLPNRHEPEGCEDIQDLPIELRRLEEDVDQIYNRADADDALPLHLKSKSLSDILGGDPADPRAVLVRSRSSVPSMALGSNAQQQQQQQQQISRQVQQSSSSSLSSKPRLVKQKQSMCEEAEEAAGGDQPTDMRNLVRALPDFKRLHGGRSVFKQSSMNEELMSTERLREKERVRQNIQKQASLNEELMYRHRPGLGHGAPGTLDSLRDTLFSASAAKRFQLLKIGLTSKLKSSTTNIEKVAGTSLKNGFVRILQGWKQAGEPLATSCTSPASGPLAEAHEQRPAGGGGGGPFGVAERERHERHERQERRHSREDGSDSSKDSSLQSDTSVDSEDSFASVIFVPKPDQFDPLGPKTPSPTLCTSAPASPQPSSLPGSLPSSPKVLLYSHSPVPSPTLPPNVPLSPRGVGSVGGPVGGAVGVAVLPPCSRAQQDTRLQQLKEALRQRNMAGRGAFPLVSCPPAAPRTAPRLLSLELFNPETDDVDSDSSGVSSPDSVDSVISVAKAAVTAEPAEPSDPADPADCGPSVSRTASCEQLAAQPQHSTSTPASLGLLEAPADGAPEDAVEPVIQASPRARRRQVNLDATDLRVTLRDDTSRSSWSLQLSPDNSPNPSRMTRMKESGSRSSLPGSLAAARGSRGSRGQENTVFKFPQPAHVPDRLRSGRQHDVELPIVLSTKTSDPEAGSGGLADAPSLTAIPETPDPSGLRAGQMQPQPPSASGERSPHSPRRSALPQVPPLVLSPREAQVADGSVGVSSPLEEESWDEGVRQHLAGFAEQLSERLLEEIVRYREDGAVRDLAKLGEELQGLSKLSLELRDRPGSASATGAAAHFDKVLANLAKNVDSSCELLSLLTKNASLASLASLRSVDSSEALTGVSSLSSSIRSTRSTDGDSAPHSELASEASDPETTAPPLPPAVVSRSLAMPPLAPAVVLADSSSAAVAADGPGPGSGSGPGPGLGLGLVPGPAQGQVPGPGPGPHTPQGTPLRPGCSLESSDGGDYSERTGSGYSGYSGYSGTDSRRDTSSASASASLGSAMESMSDVCDAASDCSRDVRFADRRTARCDGRSSSEETPGTPGTPGRQLVRQRALNALQEPPEGHGPHGHGLTKTESCTTSLSGSTSQDSLRSLPSDNANGSGGGGAITYHRYYHVFREGELDQLIERYAENLHIISSYYDHTNWCVVAEKVQVWTI